MASIQISVGQEVAHPPVDTVFVSDKVYESISLVSGEAGADFQSLLRTAGNLLIRNYGPGSISTLSMRGGTAQQSLILWNDIPMNHPMLGLTDLSLIPSFTQKVELVEVGGSTLWGSGAVGGVLKMDHEWQEDQETQIRLSIGSFSTLKGSFETQYSGNKWKGATRGSFLHSLNNFPFQRTARGPSELQRHGRFTQGHFQQDVVIKLAKSQNLSFHSWLFSGQRQLPPTITQVRSEAQQADRGSRFVVKYDLTLPSGVLKANLAYFRDDILYQDGLTGQEAASLGESANSSISYVRSLGNHLFYASVSGQWLRGTISNYNRPRSEWRKHSKVYYQYETQKVKLKGGVATSFRVDQWAPILPELHMTIPFASQSQVTLTVARHFRFPTLNDLFWLPGGNLTLRPEEGWGQNLHLTHSWQRIHTKTTLTSQVYHRLINDFILWSLPEAASFWQATNATVVRTLGAELGLRQEVSLREGSLSWETKYQYNRSRYEETLTQPSLESGSRLLLTPDHLGVASVGYTNEFWKIEYMHEFTGESRGINEDVKAFHLGHLYGELQLDDNIVGHISMRNIWNESYVLTERRPMPGRNFEIGLHIRK